MQWQEQLLERIWGFSSNRVDEAMHAYRYHVDIDEMIEDSYMRRVLLGRYGRQSMLQWDDVPVSEMKALFSALLKVIKQENTVHSEDG